MYNVYNLTENQKKLQSEVVMLIERITVPQMGDPQTLSQEDIEAEAEILAFKFAH